MSDICSSCHSDDVYLTCVPNNDGVFVHLKYKCSLCGMEWYEDKEINQDIKVRMEELNVEFDREVP